MCVKKSYHSYNHNRTLLIELSKKLAKEKFQLEQKNLCKYLYSVSRKFKRGQFLYDIGLVF